MADALYEHPRLVAIYDDLDPDRSDLVAYVDLVAELAARRVLDLGCGTGTFALMLAERGLDVIGADPALGSLTVARAKPGAEQVHWLHADGGAVPPLDVDLVTMTANAAQAIVDPADWSATLAAAYATIRPGGHLVFETRDPSRRAWTDWNRGESHKSAEIDGVGEVEAWMDVTVVDGPLVTFVWTYVFADDGAVLTSETTLRFRERSEVESDLTAAGFEVVDVRGAPDRPGRELVFIARRPT